MASGKTPLNSKATGENVASAPKQCNIYLQIVPVMLAAVFLWAVVTQYAVLYIYNVDSLKTLALSRGLEWVGPQCVPPAAHRVGSCARLMLVYLNGRGGSMGGSYIGGALEAGRPSTRNSRVLVVTVNAEHARTNVSIWVRVDVQRECGNVFHPRAPYISAAFKQLFIMLLERYPEEEHFLVFEDDAWISDGDLFYRQCDAALQQRVDFYSLWKYPAGTRCVYEMGALSFIISRSYMAQLVDEIDHFWCRRPIDMYIADSLRFSATLYNVVTHGVPGRPHFQSKIANAG